jgi:general stress protein YciG
MSGTREGGLKAAVSNKTKYGTDFYVNIGKAGGTKSRGGGFAADPELARRAGAKGGKISRRGKSKRNEWTKDEQIEYYVSEGFSQEYAENIADANTKQTTKPKLKKVNEVKKESRLRKLWQTLQS